MILGLTSRSLNPNLKLILIPLVLIVVVAVAAFWLVQQGYDRVSVQRKNLSTVNSKVSGLEGKVNLLKGISPGVLDSAEKVLIAHPNKNPSLWLVSQVKSSSKNNNLTVGKVETTSVGLTKESNMNKMDIYFELKGVDYMSLINVLNDLVNSAPLTTLNSVLISRESPEIPEMTAEIDMTVLWSDLPTQISAVNEPIPDLSQRDMDLLQKVSQLRQPDFTVLLPGERRDRPNPFQ